MKRRWVTAALFVLAVSVVHVREASAQYCGCLDPFYSYRAYRADLVPYFVSHPPIYYAYSMLKPVDPWHPLRPTEVIVEPIPTPMLLINPYVERQAGSAAKGKVSAAPLRMKNPYVAQK